MVVPTAGRWRTIFAYPYAMLSSLRKHLRQIRYYSATPVRTRWTRAMDIALFASLALAVPAMLLADVVFIRTVTVWEQHGRLARSDARSIVAHLIDAERINEAWDHSRPYGTFVLYVPQHNAGLPLVTSRRPLPMRVDLDLFTEVNLDEATALAPGEPVHAAIDAAVRFRGGQAQSAWEGSRMPPTRRWGAMGMNVVFWWFGFYVVSTAGIMLLRGCTAWVNHHRTARRKYWRDIGKCAACGYDMRGLEFSARCPECGELV